MDRSTARGRRGLVVAAMAVATVAVVAGCSSDDDGTATPTTSLVASTTNTEAPLTTQGTGPAPSTGPTLAAVPGEVQIVDYEFMPETIEVGVGETVTWVNVDAVDHWVLSTVSDAIDSATLQEGNSYAETFDEPGTVAYFCNIHNVMTGTVVVR